MATAIPTDLAPGKRQMSGRGDVREFDRSVERAPWMTSLRHAQTLDFSRDEETKLHNTFYSNAIRTSEGDVILDPIRELSLQLLRRKLLRHGASVPWILNSCVRGGKNFWTCSVQVGDNLCGTQDREWGSMGATKRATAWEALAFLKVQDIAKKNCEDRDEKTHVPIPKWPQPFGHEALKSMLSERTDLVIMDGLRSIWPCNVAINSVASSAPTKNLLAYSAVVSSLISHNYKTYNNTYGWRSQGAGYVSKRDCDGKPKLMMSEMSPLSASVDAVPLPASFLSPILQTESPLPVSTSSASMKTEPTAPESYLPIAPAVLDSDPSMNTEPVAPDSSPSMQKEPAAPESYLPIAPAVLDSDPSMNTEPVAPDSSPSMQKEPAAPESDLSMAPAVLDSDPSMNTEPVALDLSTLTNAELATPDIAVIPTVPMSTGSPQTDMPLPVSIPTTYTHTDSAAPHICLPNIAQMAAYFNKLAELNNPTQYFTAIYDLMSRLFNHMVQNSPDSETCDIFATSLIECSIMAYDRCSPGGDRRVWNKLWRDANTREDAEYMSILQHFNAHINTVVMNGGSVSVEADNMTAYFIEALLHAYEQASPGGERRTWHILRKKVDEAILSRAEQQVATGSVATGYSENMAMMQTGPIRGNVVSDSAVLLTMPMDLDDLPVTSEAGQAKKTRNILPAKGARSLPNPSTTTATQALPAQSQAIPSAASSMSTATQSSIPASKPVKFTFNNAANAPKTTNIPSSVATRLGADIHPVASAVPPPPIFSSTINNSANQSMNPPPKRKSRNNARASGRSTSGSGTNNIGGRPAKGL
ncbi:hypothetical protein VTL71DRAFT_9910 [Oculimacula yallundae]|uniref:Uncharacterized protein n=1 Tax=Oculimacula yallundae TaxID=86028 RepID=A0ABR4BQV5_9HELO